MHTPSERLSLLVKANRLLVRTARDSIGQQLEFSGWGDEEAGRIRHEDVDPAALQEFKQVLAGCQAAEEILGFHEPALNYPQLIEALEKALQEK